MSQLTLPFVVPSNYAAADFLVSPSNAEAHAALDRWPDWPGSVLLLLGPPGAGKTHLATVWAEKAGAAFVAADGFDQAWRTAAASPSVIDGVDALHLPEDALFHFLNAVRDNAAPLLMTARRGPEHWALRLRDVVSRLRLAPSVAIGPPDDALIRAVLVKLFTDRQLQVDAGLIEYLMPRIERSLAAASRIVQALDRVSLSRGRRITRAIAANVLEGA